MVVVIYRRGVDGNAGRMAGKNGKKLFFLLNGGQERGWGKEGPTKNCQPDAGKRRGAIAGYPLTEVTENELEQLQNSAVKSN